MRWLVFMLVLGVLFVNCTKTETTSYLQKSDVQLVQPRILASNMIIDSAETISAIKEFQEVDIYYTTDGKDPTLSSNKYTEPILVKESSVYNFKAFHPEFKSSESTLIKFYKKGHTPSDIKWHSEEREKYKGLGTKTLINNKKGPLEFSNPEWQGFDTIAKATVYFENKIMLSSLDIGYLTDTSSWIFPPSEIIISVTTENKGVSVITKKMDTPTEPLARSAERVEIPINLVVNSVTIEVKNYNAIPEWHEGAGTKGWLFMDEWIFN